jgi:hypothetical protein
MDKQCDHCGRHHDDEERYVCIHCFEEYEFSENQRKVLIETIDKIQNAIDGFKEYDWTKG